MSKKKINRRDFLKTGASAGALTTLQKSFFGSIVASVANEVLGQSSGASATITNPIYIMITQPGAPPRWMYDCPMYLSQADKLKMDKHSHLNTCFLPTSGSYNTGQYKVAKAIFNANGGGVQSMSLNENAAVGQGMASYFYPYLWSLQGKTATGTFNLYDLLENSMMVRGVDSTNPGHRPAQLMAHKKSRMVESSHHMSMRASDRPIACLCFDREIRNFYSQEFQATPQNTRRHNNGQGLFDDFLAGVMGENIGGSYWVKNYRKMQSELDTVLRDIASDLEVSSLDDSTRNMILKKSTERADAVKTIIENNPGMKNEFLASYDKYSKIVRRNFETQFSLISDKNIQGVNGIDATKAHFGHMTSSFALVEILIKYGICNTFVINSPSINTGQSSNDHRWSHDEHNARTNLSILGTSYNYIQMTALIREMRSFLQSEGVFHKSLIELSAEFGRWPGGGDGGMGSQHDRYNKSILMVSGKFNRPWIVGNIGHVSNRYSCGEGGVNPGFGTFLQEHVHNTIAKILDVPRIQGIEAFASLVEKNGSFVKPVAALLNPMTENSRT